MAEEFVSTTRRPQVGFAREGVSPPGALYLGPDDILFTEAWGSVVDANFGIRGRVLTPEGLVQNLLLGHNPNSDRSRSTSVDELPEGFLLGLVLDQTGAVVRRGQCYVQVSLLRGRRPTDAKQQQLIAGYLASGSDLSWPLSVPHGMLDGPGIIRSIAGTNPAAGVEISETVPTNARWRMQAVSVELVTSVTVANRRVHFVIDDGAAILGRFLGTVDQTASLTVRYTFGPHVGEGILAQGVIDIRSPFDLYLPQGSRIRTITTSLQAGDDFGAPQLSVEEWIEE